MKKYTDDELRCLKKRARTNMDAYAELCEYYENQDMAKRMLKAALRKMEDEDE